jgi:ketosteroid isomerase-like protein
MIPRIFPILTVLSLAATVPALTATAIRFSTPRAEIQNNYNKIAAAFARKDLTGATSYFTADYVNIDDQGTQKSAAELREQYEPLLRRVKVVKSRIAIQDFQAQGNRANALVKQRSDLLWGNKKIVREDTFRDSWVKTGQGWRIQRSQTLTVNTTLDGQPI